MNDRFNQYIQYIKNTGGNPTIEWFDDDFEPIGSLVRADMKEKRIIEECDGKIKLLPPHDKETTQ